MPYYFIIKKVHSFNYYLNQTTTTMNEFMLEGLKNNATKFTKWEGEKHLNSLQLQYPLDKFELKPE